MKIDSRTIHFFDLSVTTISLNAAIPAPPQISMDLIIQRLLQKIKAGTEIKNSKNPIEVTQIESNFSESEFILLLNRPDPERSDVAYKKRKTKSRRLGDKAADEDIEVSAHVFVKMDGNSSTAKMLLSVGAGISPAKIVALLNASYKSAKSENDIKSLRHLPFPTKTLNSNGGINTYEVNHRFSFSAMPNSLLTDIIKTGKVTGLNLIDLGSEAFDTSVKGKVDKLELHIDLRTENVDLSVIKKIISIAKSKRNLDANKLRIEYTDGDGVDPKPRDKTFDASQIEQAFTRSESISLDFPHHDHQTKISEKIIKKMRALT